MRKHLQRRRETERKPAKKPEEVSISEVGGEPGKCDIKKGRA